MKPGRGATPRGDQSRERRGFWTWLGKIRLEGRSGSVLSLPWSSLAATATQDNSDSYKLKLNEKFTSSCPFFPFGCPGHMRVCAHRVLGWQGERACGSTGLLASPSDGTGLKVSLDSAGPDHTVPWRLKSRGKHMHSKATALDPAFLPEHRPKHHCGCTFIKPTSSNVSRCASKLTADFATKLRIG